MNSSDDNTGIRFLPYITKTKATDINGITVWHSNKFINFWIKVKHFFYKPKALKNFEKYANKPVNTKYYGTLRIDKDEQIR